MPDEPVSLEAAKSVAKSMLGHVPDRIESFRPAAGGDSSYNFRLWSGRQAMLLKIMRRPHTPIGVYFHSRVKSAGVPVPDLIAYASAAGPSGQACAIWEWVEGVWGRWKNGEHCPYDEAELGRIVRRIHDLEFDGPFGFLGDDPGTRTFAYVPDLAPTSQDWPGHFLCDRAARRYLEKGYITQREADILATLPQRVGAPLRYVPCRLLHMSDIMNGSNLLLDPATGRIRAVLDYVESMAGDPRWELSWFDYYFVQFPFGDGRFDMARFRDSYGTSHDRDDPLGRFYLAAILLFEKLLWFPPGELRTEWAVRTLRQILDEFGGQP